jgi:NAD(P)-dependent dehydrogenase (short-subunit alcohol dehydrogenase family)
MRQYVISGASGGLGYALVKELKNRGQNNIVGLYNKNEPDLDIELLQADLSTDNNISDKLTPVVTGDEIIFVHLAGISLNAVFKKFDFDDARAQYQLNVLSGLQIASALWPKMKEKQFGRIIFISSVVAHAPVFGTLGYSMTKAAMEAATRSLAAEGAKDGIYSFCIASGYTEFGLIKQVPQEFQDILKKQIPLKRFGTADEFTNTVEFLCNSPYMNGQTLHLNGGLYFG